MGSVPLLTSLADTRNIATCLFFGCCFLIAYRGIADFEVRLIQYIFLHYISNMGHTVAQLIEALRYKPEMSRVQFPMT
jgi:hypothetical protein